VAPSSPDPGADPGTVGAAYANRPAKASQSREPPWYVGAAVKGSPTRAFMAAALAMTGCGAGARSESADGVHTVRIVRVVFPARQHLAQHATFAITVRNAGDATIASVVGTLRGLSARAADGTDRRLWIADEPQGGSVAAIDDARATGPLKAGAEVTLRWSLTAVAAGTHRLAWDISGGSRTQLPGGGSPRGGRTVRVAAKPPFARVDPRTGRVIREKSPPSG
jgi:hypothetical protein